MTSTVQNSFRILLGAALTYAGLGHLAWSRSEFEAQVPGWVPLSAEFVVVASGVVEIALGIALVVWVKQRVVLGWVAAAFFVAIFPGNISQYIDGDAAFGLNSDAARLIRLTFQPVLVAWSLWCTGAWSAWRHHAGGAIAGGQENGRSTGDAHHPRQWRGLGAAT